MILLSPTAIFVLEKRCTHIEKVLFYRNLIFSRPRNAHKHSEIARGKDRRAINGAAPALQRGRSRGCTPALPRPLYPVSSTAHFFGCPQTRRSFSVAPSRTDDSSNAVPLLVTDGESRGERVPAGSVLTAAAGRARRGRARLPAGAREALVSAALGQRQPRSFRRGRGAEGASRESREETTVRGSRAGTGQLRCAPRFRFAAAIPGEEESFRQPGSPHVALRCCAGHIAAARALEIPPPSGRRDGHTAARAGGRHGQQPEPHGEMPVSRFQTSEEGRAGASRD